MIKKLRDYINSRILLMRLEVSERFAKALALLFQNMVVLMFFGIFFFFASMAAAFWIGESVRSIPVGFAVVAGFYLAVTLVLFVFRKSLIETPFMNKVIRILFEHKKHEEEKALDK